MLEKSLALKILGSLLAVEAFIDFGRLLVPGLSAKIVGLFGGIHREGEVSRVSGIFWTLAGSFTLMLLIPDRTAVLCAMSFLIFGDSAAALVGVPYGRHKFWGKSVEGSAAFFTASALAGLFFYDPVIAFAGALVATLVECLPFPWNDNFWVPVLSGCFLFLVG